MRTGVLLVAILVLDQPSRATTVPRGNLAAVTFVGGGGDDQIVAVAADSAGHIYVAGTTTSTNLPTTVGVFQPSPPPGTSFTHGFVAKLAPDASLVWLSYLGGSFNDTPAGLAVDAAGDVFVAGSTSSNDFPTTANAYLPTCTVTTPGTGCGGAFLTKISNDGHSLLWSSYLHGAPEMGVPGVRGAGVALAQGLACITGDTQTASLPVTADAPQPSTGGGHDAFVSCFDTTLSGSASLVFSSYFGGAGADGGTGIAADASGRIFVGGHTSSLNFPIANAAQPAPGGSQGQDGFVLALSPTRAVVFATYVGGSDTEDILGIATAGDGTAAITGTTRSRNFPTFRALQTALGGGATTSSGDGFVAKYDAAGAIVFSTYLGGYNDDYPETIAAESDGAIHVCGATQSPDFPALPGAVDTHQTNGSGFALGLTPDGSAFFYATFYETFTLVTSCAAGSDLIMAGSAPNGTVVIGNPVSGRAGGLDGFLARIASGTPGTVDLEVSGNPAMPLQGGGVSVTPRITNHGPSTATGVVLRGQAPYGSQLLVNGTNCWSGFGYWVECDIGTMTPNLSLQIPLSIMTFAPGNVDVTFWTIENQSDSNAANDRFSIHSAVGQSHFVPVASYSPSAIAQGEEALLTAGASNGGPDAADGVQLVISAPSASQLASPSPPAGCQFNAGTSQLTCSLGMIPAGGAAQVQVPILLISAGPSRFSVQASSFNRDSSSVEADAPITVTAANATLTASPSVVTINSGQSINVDLALAATVGRFLAGFEMTCTADGGLDCSITPPVLSPGAGTAHAVLAISSAPRMGGVTGSPRPKNLWPLVLAILGLAAVMITRRHRASFAWGAAAVLLAACVGSCSDSSPAVPDASVDAAVIRDGQPGDTGAMGVPPGTYHVNVTATLGGPAYFGSVVRTTQVTVNVN
jgi:hypothetical protein